MAYNSGLFIAALVLFAAASQSAQVSAAPVNGLTISGRLCCAANGNCPGQGVGGVAVRLNCTVLGQTATVGVAITDATGAYNITVPALPGLVLGLPVAPCVVVVRLPLEAAVCSVLSTTTGVLVGTLSIVGTVVTAVLGLVQSAIVNPLFHVLHHASALFLLVLLPLAATVAGQTVNGMLVNLEAVTLGGRVCCTRAGNCPGERGVGGASVSLRCYSEENGNVTAGHAATNATGSFNITVSRLPDGVNIFNLPQYCYVEIPLPPAPGAAANCPQLAATGTLSSNISPVGFVATRDCGVIMEGSVVRYRKKAA